MPHISRRTLLVTFGALTLARPARAAAPSISVMKDPTCGCCGAWVEILRAEGFDVTVDLADDITLAEHKRSLGVPVLARACHTAQVEGYVIEGHVPPAEIRRILLERPDANGLSVPGMPNGAPGMGEQTDQGAYDVFLMGWDGTVSIYASHPAL